MLEKWNNILNVVMGSFAGVFIGHALYVYWEYRKSPALYAMQSAPWYTSIAVYGAVTIVILLIAGILKDLIQKKQKRL